MHIAESGLPDGLEVRIAAVMMCKPSNYLTLRQAWLFLDSAFSVCRTAACITLCWLRAPAVLTKWSSSDLPQGWPLPPPPSHQQAFMQSVVQLSIPLSRA